MGSFVVLTFLFHREDTSVCSFPPLFSNLLQLRQFPRVLKYDKAYCGSNKDCTFQLEIAHVAGFRVRAPRSAFAWCMRNTFAIFPAAPDVIKHVIFRSMQVRCNNADLQYARIMARGSILSVASLLLPLLLVPSSVICSYPWPDSVTQYKGYIQVSPALAS